MRRHVTPIVTVLLLATLGFTGTAPATAAKSPQASRVNVDIRTQPPMDLRLVAMTAHEELSQPFRLRIDVATSDPTINGSVLLGSHINLTVTSDTGAARTFDGTVTTAVEYPTGKRDTRYRLLVEPTLALLEHTQDNRIFQQRSSPTIVADIADGAGIDVAIELAETYQPAACATQYRESDFAFVTRLMEEEGIFYWFRHGSYGHTLVLADAAGPEIDGGSIDAETTRASETFTPARITVDDYNFLTPDVDLTASVDSATSTLDPLLFEIYDYPGDYTTPADGLRSARVRTQAADVTALTLVFATDEITVAPGQTVSIGGPFSGKYFVTSARHLVDGKTNKLEYSTEFVAVPSATPFRPPRTTPKPTIAGPQTAIVTGPAGEEIYTDEHGRVKVQFHWDRGGQNDENSSCWIRVSLVHRGGIGGDGAPRVGDEVIVDFLEGDPDRPIVIGRVSTSEPPSD